MFDRPANLPLGRGRIYPILTLVHIVCARLAFHDAGSIAVQFNHLRPPSPMASPEWSQFFDLRCCDRNFGTSDELWHAGYRWLKSSGGDDTVRHVLSIRAV